MAGKNSEWTSQITEVVLTGYAAAFQDVHWRYRLSCPRCELIPLRHARFEFCIAYCPWTSMAARRSCEVEVQGCPFAGVYIILVSIPTPIIM